MTTAHPLSRRLAVIGITILVVISGVAPFVSLSSSVGTAAAEGSPTIDDFEDENTNIETDGWTGWSGDTEDLTTTTTDSISENVSGIIQSDSDAHDKIWANASSSQQIDRFGIKIQKEVGAGVSYFRLYNNDNRAISFRSNDGELEVQQSGTWSGTGYAIADGSTHFLEARNITYADTTYELWANGQYVGTYDFNSDDTAIDSVQLEFDNQNGYLIYDDVEVNGSNYQYDDSFSGFSDSFDDESADSGVPQQFEAVTDPRGLGHSRNVDVEEVQTRRSWEGGQSYYAEESSGGNVITMRPSGQPYDTYKTEDVSIVLNRPDTNLEGDGGSGGTALLLFGETGEDPNIEVVHREGALKHRNPDGSYSNITTEVNFNEWVRVEVFNIDTENDTYSVEWRTEEGESGTAHDLTMWNGMEWGYRHTITEIDDSGYIDSLAVKDEGVTIENNAPVRVVDQNGDPVEDATVEAIAVDTANLNDSVDDLEAESERLLDEASDPSPPEFVPQDEFSVDAVVNDAENQNTVYTTAHTRSEMGLTAWTESPDLSPPTVRYNEGETVHLYAWDPSGGGLDGVSRQHAGGIQDGATWTIEQVDHTGDTTDSFTVEADNTYEVGTWPATTEHNYGTADLPEGFYRVTPEVDGETGVPMYVVVGNPAEVIESELRDEADSLTDRAQETQDLLNEGKFSRQTAVTNETGYADLGSFPSSVEVVSVQAFKGPNVEGLSPSEVSLSDLRDVRDTGYNGSLYVSDVPTRTTPTELSSGGVTVEMTKIDTEPFSGIEDYQDLLDRLENELLDDSTAELEQFFEDRLEELQRDELERRHDELLGLVGSNDDLRDRANEILGDGDAISDSPGDLTDEELREEIRAMEQALADTDNVLPPPPEPPDTEIDGGELHATFPFGEDLDSDAVSVVVHWQNGTSSVVDEEYYRVESAGVTPLGGDQVVVDGYPIPADAAVADVEVTGISEDGRLGSVRDSIVNPAFDENIPDVDAIDVSTLRPGVGESVGLSVRPGDDSTFGSVEAVDVYHDGTQLDTTMDNGRARFTPTDTGVHNVRVTYSNDAGTPFVQSFRIEAKQEPTSDPPTVRVIDGLGGPTAIAGDKLDSARVTVSDQQAEIVAQVPGGQSPSNVDVRAQSLDAHTIDLKVVSGTDEQSVDNHVSVRLFTDFVSEESIVYRKSAWRPIVEDGETKYGSWETRESSAGDTHRVVSTYTDASGEVTIGTVRDPGLIERVQHRVAVSSPVELPFAAIAGMTLHIIDALLGLTPTEPMSTALTTPEPAHAVATTASTVTAPSSAAALEVAG